jgi:hypothetical protein
LRDESSIYAVALFTVLNGTAPAGAYSATIDWGDGSPVSSATIVGDPGGPFNVVGSHAYAQAGNFTAQVTISELGNSANTATTTKSANISNFAIEVPEPPATGRVS